MAVTYRIGYAQQRVDLAGLRAWSRFAGVHPEIQRRVIAMMDAARAAGVDLGVGGALRTTAEQEQLFLSRHHVSITGCCWYKLRRYQLNDGAAHAAPPGKSYHEPTIDGRCAALDMVGWESGWLERNAGRFAMRTFTEVNGERWHIQPTELPASRSSYDPLVHKLNMWSATALPYGAWPTTLKPTLRVGDQHDAVRYLERVLNERAGQHCAIDRVFDAGTAVAVRNLQSFFGLVVDGVVGSQTWPVIDMLATR
jgi:hypothetical protein